MAATDATVQQLRVPVAETRRVSAGLWSDAVWRLRLEPFPFAMFLGLLGWLGICNYARGQTISLREREYVLAARTVGCTPLRLMVRHIVPNILPLIIVLGMIEIGQLILTESAISFIGFGIQPPTPSWGNMLTNAAQYLSKAPHLIFPPGLAVVVTVLCLYLVGDGLRDALDPRLRGAIGTRR